MNEEPKVWIETSDYPELFFIGGSVRNQLGTIEEAMALMAARGGVDRLTDMLGSLPWVGEDER